VVYSTLYGAGADSLAEQLNVTAGQARKISNNFLNRFPRIRKFRSAVVSSCEKKGYTETICGFVCRAHVCALACPLQPQQAVSSRVKSTTSPCVVSPSTLIGSMRMHVYVSACNCRRRRYFADISSHTTAKKLYAQKQCFNHVLQGSAAGTRNPLVTPPPLYYAKLWRKFILACSPGTEPSST